MCTDDAIPFTSTKKDKLNCKEEISSISFSSSRPDALIESSLLLLVVSRSNL